MLLDLARGLSLIIEFSHELESASIALSLLWRVDTLSKYHSTSAVPSRAQIRRLVPKAQAKWSVSRKNGATNLAVHQRTPESLLEAASWLLDLARELSLIIDLSRELESASIALSLLWSVYTLSKYHSTSAVPSRAQIRRLVPKAQAKWSVSHRSSATNLAVRRFSSTMRRK